MKGTLRYLAGIAGPSGYGSNSTAEQVAQDCSNCSVPNSQLTAIVTGATSGIGAETAKVLAKRGVRVVIPARDVKRAYEVRESIQKENPEADIILLEIDLSSFASVKRFCSEFLSLGLPLNILIYNGTRAYAQSKLANILHAKEMARQLKARNARVTVNAVHPGIVKTGIIRDHKGCITGMQSAASTTCYVALSPQTEGVSGKYFADCNESYCSALANDESEAQNLWRQSRALICRRLHQSSVA
ncbi:NAD(P)-binding Rossmann-fold superfamily protein [Actinidia rufa]|uniref:NAD(P)-binding Rossmann-fold superfamily protein n=1 Tax=Actinidia rufa TaxID=165716 RepID=A0A7J0FYW1_9ERIC|nr:NAD(P)-binding Rossmann-fold superfamily protein [Actinidia rufa]